MGGAVEQVGDVDRHVIVGGRQFALRQPFQRAQRGLDARLGADHVVEYFFALVIGQVQRGQHLEIGSHRGQRSAQFVGGHRGKITGRGQRLLGADLLVPDALQHAAHGFGDLHGFAGTVHFDPWCLVAGIDAAGLFGQLLERTHRENGQQPGEHGRRADGELLNDINF